MVEKKPTPIETTNEDLCGPWVPVQNLDELSEKLKSRLEPVVVGNVPMVPVRAIRRITEGGGIEKKPDQSMKTGGRHWCRPRKSGKPRGPGRYQETNSD